jgi:hypothetical protein
MRSRVGHEPEREAVLAQPTDGFDRAGYRVILYVQHPVEVDKQRANILEHQSQTSQIAGRFGLKPRATESPSLSGTCGEGSISRHAAH